MAHYLRSGGADRRLMDWSESTMEMSLTELGSILLKDLMSSMISKNSCRLFLPIWYRLSRMYVRNLPYSYLVFRS